MSYESVMLSFMLNLSILVHLVVFFEACRWAKAFICDRPYKGLWISRYCAAVDPHEPYNWFLFYLASLAAVLVCSVIWPVTTVVGTFIMVVFGLRALVRRWRR